MGKLNAALQKNVKNLLDVNEAWTKYAISCEIKNASISHKLEVTLDEVSRLQKLLPRTSGLAAPRGAMSCFFPR